MLSSWWFSSDGEVTRRVSSQVEKHVRFSGGAGSGITQVPKGAGEDTRERRHEGQLDRYYDDVITHLRDAHAILIFGPGEAKGELKARLERDGLGGSVVAVEAADKMTDRQIAAKVRERFPR
jgi:hypothetical protein